MSHFATVYFTVIGSLLFAILTLTTGIAWLLVRLRRRPGAWLVSLAVSQAGPGRAAGSGSAIPDLDDHDDHLATNPATGLLMLHGPHGLDILGNPYGSDLSSADPFHLGIFGSNAGALPDLPTDAWHPLLEDGAASNPILARNVGKATDGSSDLGDFARPGSNPHDL